jgi:murein DD-endopeptidase MepM/ murein hydrolase activator NlpD
MKPSSIQTVPAGKRPKINKPPKFKYLSKRLTAWFRAKKVRGTYFAAGAAFAVLILLGLFNYMNNYVYVVFFDDQEVGVVGNAGEIEDFVADLADRCGDLYGMGMEPGEKITLIKEFRPDSKPAPGAVQTIIRQRMTFLTDAYMIKIEGQPLVPVHSEEDLDRVIASLKASYIRSGSGVRVLDAFVTEDLELEVCSVNPDEIFSPEEVVSLLTAQSRQRPPEPAYFSFLPERGLSESSHSASHDSPAFYAVIMPRSEWQAAEKASSDADIHIKVIEEVTVTEIIPFSVEYVYDDEMWVVQKEVTTQGEEGKKELVYHIVRENGVEIERTKISEAIISEPVTQIEALGTVKVPSMGTGQFIWPVEGGGEVTPGRGFSPMHTGIDIHASTGTNVLAADSGVVWFSGRGGSQGNYIIIYHGSHWTLYLHNSQNLVSEGAEVAQGQVIAKVGSTGRSSGPHLHFEVRADDGTGEWLTYFQHQPIDPLLFFQP